MSKNYREQLSRRDLIRVGGLATVLLGGGGVALWLASGGERESSGNYTSYRDHVRSTSFYLPVGDNIGWHQYIEFGENEFEKIAEVASPMITIEKHPPQENHSLSGADIAEKFDELTEKMGATTQFEHVSGSHFVRVYFNSETMSADLDGDAIDSFLGWARATSELRPYLYDGEVIQFLVIGRFNSNPMLPETYVSSTLSAGTGVNLRVSATVINLAETADGPTNAFATELLQAEMNLEDRLLQEKLANSTALAYEYALDR